MSAKDVTVTAKDATKHATISANDATSAPRTWL